MPPRNTTHPQLQQSERFRRLLKKIQQGSKTILETVIEFQLSHSKDPSTASSNHHNSTSSSSTGSSSAVPFTVVKVENIIQYNGNITICKSISDQIYKLLSEHIPIVFNYDEQGDSVLMHTPAHRLGALSILQHKLHKISRVVSKRVLEIKRNIRKHVKEDLHEAPLDFSEEIIRPSDAKQSKDCGIIAEANQTATVSFEVIPPQLFTREEIDKWITFRPFDVQLLPTDLIFFNTFIRSLRSALYQACKTESIAHTDNSIRECIHVLKQTAEHFRNQLMRCPLIRHSAREILDIQRRANMVLPKIKHCNLAVRCTVRIDAWPQESDDKAGNEADTS